MGGTDLEVQTPCLLQQSGWWVGLTKKFKHPVCCSKVGGGWGTSRSSNTLFTAAKWVGLTKKFKHPVYCSKVGGGWGSPRSSDTLFTAAKWVVGGAHQEVQTPCVLQQGGWWVGFAKKFKHPVYCSKVGGGWGSPRSSNTLCAAARWVVGGVCQEVQTPCLL